MVDRMNKQTLSVFNKIFKRHDFEFVKEGCSVSSVIGVGNDPIRFFAFSKDWFIFRRCTAVERKTGGEREWIRA